MERTPNSWLKLITTLQSFGNEFKFKFEFSGKEFIKTSKSSCNLSDYVILYLEFI